MEKTYRSYYRPKGYSRQAHSGGYYTDLELVAEDLGYGEDVIEKLHNAKTEAEKERIMVDARRKK